VSFPSTRTSSHFRKTYQLPLYCDFVLRSKNDIRIWYFPYVVCRLRFKCDATRAETRFRLSAKRTSPFKSAGASVQLTTGSRGVCISGSNAGYTMFRVSVKGTGYPLHLLFPFTSPPLRHRVPSRFN
jgi:hypothetical protein